MDINQTKSNILTNTKFITNVDYMIIDALSFELFDDRTDDLLYKMCLFIPKSGLDKESTIGIGCSDIDFKWPELLELEVHKSEYVTNVDPFLTFYDIEVIFKDEDDVNSNWTSFVFWCSFDGEFYPLSEIVAHQN